MASTFLANKFVSEGLTYDDVLLVPAYSEVEAIQQFLGNDIAMVIFGCDLKKEMEYDLARYFKIIDPNIILLDPFGGGTGLLHQEINNAFEKERDNKLIS